MPRFANLCTILHCQRLNFDVFLKFCFSGISSLVVDGDDRRESPYCTSSGEGGGNPWFVVDLGFSTTVTSVALHAPVFGNWISCLIFRGFVQYHANVNSTLKCFFYIWSWRERGTDSWRVPNASIFGKHLFFNLLAKLYRGTLLF